MAKSMESSDSSDSRATDGRPSGWLKLGAIATVSVLAGGLAAAWWYRNTVKNSTWLMKTSPIQILGFPGTMQRTGSVLIVRGSDLEE